MTEKHDISIDQQGNLARFEEEEELSLQLFNFHHDFPPSDARTLCAGENGREDDGLVAIPTAADGPYTWPHDPMDVDYDAELATWISSWSHPNGDVGLLLGLDPIPYEPEPERGMTGPGDLLFPDDEVVFPTIRLDNPRSLPQTAPDQSGGIAGRSLIDYDLSQFPASC